MTTNGYVNNANTMKKVNWSATKPSTTTVQWKDQTTLVGRPTKSVMPIYFSGADRDFGKGGRGGVRVTVKY